MTKVEAEAVLRLLLLHPPIRDGVPSHARKISPLSHARRPSNFKKHDHGVTPAAEMASRDFRRKLAYPLICMRPYAHLTLRS